MILFDLDEWHVLGLCCRNVSVLVHLLCRPHLLLFLPLILALIGGEQRLRHGSQLEASLGENGREIDGRRLGKSRVLANGVHVREAQN